MGQDGINSSQLGIRGVEDLGGGLRAGFTLLSGINADTGGANSKFWNRRSTVSLFGGWGELRLGRDYIPTFWNLTIFDAFGTNGLGSSSNVRQLYGGTRSDNSIGYFLPANLGGFYGQFMAAAAESGTTLERPARYLGGRVGFAAGPFDVAVVFLAAAVLTGRRNYVPDECTNRNRRCRNAGQFRQEPSRRSRATSRIPANVGGSWDFGFFKMLGLLQRGQDQERQREDGLGQRRDPLRPGRSARGLRPQQVHQRQRELEGGADQGHVPVQPVEADRGVHDRFVAQEQGHDSLHPPWCRSCGSGSGGQRAATRKVSNSVCATSSDRSSSASKEPNRKAAFGRPFFALFSQESAVRVGGIPFDD